MKSSPGLQTLPPDELQGLIDSVDTLPEENRLKIFQAMENEKLELEKIKTEYEDKKLKLLEEYEADVKQEEIQMASELRNQLEKTERTKETEIMDGLLKQLG